MKTKILSPLITIAAVMFVTTASFSQSSANSNKMYDAYSAVNIAGFTLGDLYTDASAGSEVAVTTKIQRSFDQYFAGASGQYWSMVGKNFHNSFYANGLLIRALFSKTGNLIYAISYGGESDLPAEIRKDIKSTYYDYKITMAINVKENKRDIWVVSLDNETEQLKVRLEDGDMEEVQQIVKSK